MLKDLKTRRADGRRLTIGYIAQHAYDGLGLQYLKGVYDAARDYDLNLINAIGGSTIRQREVNRSEITVSMMINSQTVDGLISLASSLVYYQDTPDPEMFHQRFEGLPLVSIASPLKNRPSLLIDNEQGTRIVMRHLIETHQIRKPVYIQSSDRYFAVKRFEAYQKCLKEYGIPYDAALVVKTPEVMPSQGIAALAVLLDERQLTPGRDFDAIITNSDIIAAAIVPELVQRGFKVPKDVLVVGFNNRLESLTCTPPLTTVKVEFYQYGYRAVETLLRVIAGEAVPLEIFMPTELIVRQSCGCFEHSVLQAKTTVGAKVEPSEIAEPLRIAIKQAVRELVQEWGEGDWAADSKVKDWIRELADSFLTDLLNVPAENQFLYEMNNLIMYVRNKKTDILLLQDLLTEVRQRILPLLIGHPLQVVAEDLWHQARILIFNALDYYQNGMLTKDTEKSNNLVQIGGIFNPVLSFEELLDLIVQELPRLGIPGCYMALYEDRNRPEDTSRLILGFNKYGRIDVNRLAQPFPTLHLLPEGVLQADERFCFILQSCFYQERQLGYVVFEMGPLEGAIYEILRSNFNASLYSALTAKERRRIQDEREILLSTLELKKAELEEKNRDIHNVNVQLQLALEKVNQANQAKSRFLANMSHEIRTPLNCIVGFAEIMNNTRDQEKQTHYTQLIIDESEKLLELINQLLDISKIEAGKMQLKLEPFDLLGVMRSIDAAFTVIAQNKGLQYFSEVDKGISGQLIGDALRLRQVLINLIGNAIKFTAKGVVQVSVEVMYQTLREITLLFKIKDTGVGITPEKLKTIFEPFVQVENSTTRKYGGTGLGTTISKEFVNLMKGEIGVQSQLNQGSVFWFTAVFEKNNAGNTKALSSANPEVGEVVPEEVRNAVILLVEDYPANREVAVAHLNHLGCKIVSAENGQVAVDCFQAQPVDLILMDLQMPEMDGLTATKIIRQLPGGEAIPILAVTANAFESDIAECLACGMNDVVTKPFRKDLLRAKLIYWLMQGKRELVRDANPSPVLGGLEAAHQGNAAQPVPPLSLEQVLEDFDYDQAIVTKVLSVFKNNLEQQVVNLERAVRENDCEKLWKEAHSIKGGASNLRAERLAQVAAEVEALGKKGELAEGTRAVTALKTEIETFRTYLDMLNK